MLTQIYDTVSQTRIQNIVCVHSYFRIGPIVLKFSTEHARHTVVLCGNFQNDQPTKRIKKDKNDFVELKVNYGEIYPNAMTPYLPLWDTGIR